MEVSPASRRTDRTTLEALLAKVAAGDREALAELYDATRGAVYAMALSVLHNAEDAGDITQDTYVRVWTGAGQYKSNGTPMAWILTVTRNLARMKLREHSRTTELTEAEWDAIPAQAEAVTVEDREVLERALSGLGLDERQIVLLHAASGLKHREIAALLEIPIATVLSKYHRALKKMRAVLEGDEAK